MNSFEAWQHKVNLLVLTGFLLASSVQVMFPVTLRKQWHGRRYNSYNRLLKDTFDARVYKIGLELDFTCPNRDGTVAVGGCITAAILVTATDYRPQHR
jgi:hypothetical protein